MIQDREHSLRVLVVAGLAGDTHAYARFLRELAALLRGFLRKRLSAMPDEVEDLVQEVLIAVHNQRHTYDSAQPVTAWAHAIAKYKLIDFYRRNSRRGDSVDIDDVADLLATSDHDAHDAKRDVASLLEALPPKQRDAIECVKLEGLSIAEASKRTGQSESLVKVNIHRGLKALAARMREAP